MVVLSASSRSRAGWSALGSARPPNPQQFPERLTRLDTEFLRPIIYGDKEESVLVNLLLELVQVGEPLGHVVQEAARLDQEFPPLPPTHFVFALLGDLGEDLFDDLLRGHLSFSIANPTSTSNMLALDSSAVWSGLW